MTKKNQFLTLLMIVTVCFLLLIAYRFAGMILFALFFENPLHSNWSTIWNAITMAETAGTTNKLVASLILSFIVVLGIPFAIFMSWLTKPKSVEALHGEARFANLKDILSKKFNSAKGVVIGKFNEMVLRFPGYEFVLLAAPTRSGKGVSFVIPNLLDFDGSVVVLDIKGENYNLTSRFRQEKLKNEIFYFNPFSENTHRWNPLSYVSKDSKYMASDLMALAMIIYPEGDPKNQFWVDSARNIFLGIGLMVLETPLLPHTLGEILRQASGKGKPIAEYLEEIFQIRMHSNKALSPSCVTCLQRFLNNSEDTMKNILSSFSAPLSIWVNPIVDLATSADDFDLRDVRKKKMSIYINIAASDVTKAGFILNMFFSQLINENVKQLPEENKDLKYPCLLLMDEFTSVGKIEIISKAIGFIAGYNLRLAIVIQDRSQIEAVYGKEEAKNIFANMGVSIFFAPTDIETAESYSKMLGNQTVKVWNAQHSNVGSLNAGAFSTTMSEQQQSRALMLPQELREMSQESTLISRTGIPIIKAMKLQYYLEPSFRDRFFSVQTTEAVVGGEKRTVPVPLPLQDPKPSWSLLNGLYVRSDYYMKNDFRDLKDNVDDH
ncbi:MAG: type IV secretory system conjugative DNA transfer family protein [Methylophilaceae bacterium]|nr:type IV secretory system conjugative DNA transfer family protein [Methylophilaceae bacterium]